MGVSRYLREKNPAIRIIGAQPAEGSQIPGIRKWPEPYLPKIYDASRVDRIESVTQAEAETLARRLAAEEGIFCGISAGGACAIALRIAAEVENATIVSFVCDRGDRYLSNGVFPVDPSGNGDGYFADFRLPLSADRSDALKSVGTDRDRHRHAVRRTRKSLPCEVGESDNLRAFDRLATR